MKHTSTIAAIPALSLSCHAEEAKQLFVLSGQSNMFHLDSGESFRPAVEQAFGEENVIIAKTAKRGAPIIAWDNRINPWRA